MTLETRPENLSQGDRPPEPTATAQYSPAEYVQQIINKRDEIWPISDLEEARSVFLGYRDSVLGDLDEDKRESVEDFLIPPLNTSAPELLQFYKKKALLLYQLSITPHEKIRLDAEERNISIKERLNNLYESLSDGDSTAIVFSMGSYAKGKLNNGFSDLDMIVVIDTDDQEEVERWRSGSILSEAGIDEVPQDPENWDKFEQGEGDLLRVFGGDEDYNEIELHVLSLRAATDIHKLYPGKIKRISSREPIVEQRTSFDGHRTLLPKPADVVPHYTAHEDRVYRGFFPETIMTAHTIYDPESQGSRIVEEVWYSNLKAFLYHNEGYETDDQGNIVGIKDEFRDAKKHISTLYYGSDEDYSVDRWMELLNRHRKALRRVEERIVGKKTREDSTVAELVVPPEIVEVDVFSNDTL